MDAAKNRPETEDVRVCGVCGMPLNWHTISPDNIVTHPAEALKAMAEKADNRPHQGGLAPGQGSVAPAGESRHWWLSMPVERMTANEMKQCIETVRRHHDGLLRDLRLAEVRRKQDEAERLRVIADLRDSEARWLRERADRDGANRDYR